MMGGAAVFAGGRGLPLGVAADRRIDGMAALGPHKMSMLQDLEHGRSMEIEALVGVVAELGRLLDVPTPTVDLVLALIRQRARCAPASGDSAAELASEAASVGVLP